MTTPLIEAIARALCEAQGYEATENEMARAADEAQAALTAITEAGYVIVPREPPAGAYQAMLPAVMAGSASDIYRAMINAADHIMPPIRDAGPLESEEGE